MILYTNGCSFVAGNGLALDLLPGWPGDLKYPDDLAGQARRRQWVDNTRSSHKRIWDKIPMIERKRNFPALIRNILKCKLFDASFGGSSFDRIARTTLSDLTGLIQKHNEPIVAIIGDTHPFRKEIAAKREATKWYDLHPANTEISPEIQHVFKYMIYNETDYHRWLEFYKNWILIKDFCRLNNIELHWVNVGFTNEPHQHIIDANEDLKNLYTYLDLKASVDMTAQALKARNQCCADGGHFSAEVHQLVASAFIKILEKYQE